MYEKGCMLYHKQAGDTVFFDRDLGDDEFLVSPAVVYVCGDGIDEPHYEEVCPAITKLVVHSSDYSDQPPKQPIPKYLDEDIQAAKKRVESLSERYQQLSKQMADERDEHSKHMKALKERVSKLTPRRKRLMELLLAHLEGVDLYVLNVGNTSYSIKRLSEFKGDYGARMLGLHGDFGNDDKKYDWHIHQYSDDSGSWSHCLVAQNLEELKERALEYKKTLSTGNDWRRVHFLKFLVEQFQYELAESELLAIQKDDKERAEAAIKERDKRINSLAQQAESLGYVLQACPNVAVPAPKRPEQP